MLSAVGVEDSVRLPADDPSLGNTRSLASFERAFRRVLLPLQALWVASQFAPERPERVVALVRLQVSQAGAAEAIDVRGNVPDGLPTELLRAVVRVGVRLPPGGGAGIYDFVLAVGP